MLNAWEMAKLRTYYLHGPFDDGVEVWEAMMQDWCRRPAPCPSTEAPLLPDRSTFATEAEFRAALHVYERSR